MTVLPENCEEFFNSANIVKSGKIREVRCKDGIFIKLDRRKNHSFKSEFECALKLKKADIPVTEPLFYTSGKNGNYLATREFKGVSLEDLLKNGVPDQDFFQALTGLLAKMHRAGFIHRDFHLGNLLYSPEEKRFALVDVDSICRIPSFLVPLVPQRIRFHILTEFRPVLNDGDLLQLFASANVTAPEKFLRETFIRNAKYIRHHWQRRTAQIFAGYPKFTRIDANGVIFDRNAENCDFESAETIHDPDARIFLAHFYLDQIRMPHRRAIKFDPSTAMTTLAVSSTLPADGAAAESMIRRLKFYGIDTVRENWKQGVSPLPELHALEKAAELPFITGGK